MFPKRLFKLLQLRFYSFLSSKWGFPCLCIMLFVSFNTAFQFIGVFMAPAKSPNTTVMRTEWGNTTVTFHKDKNTVCIPEIDIVYTWVNGSDPRHIEALRQMKVTLLGEIHRLCNSTEDPSKDNCTKDEETMSRFNDNDELKYSLRSVEKNANWIRNIYLVTNGQIPNWLNLSNPRLQVITHEDIYLNKSHLPVFSSPSIECHLHRIPGLADNFIYFNDDTMLGSPVWPDDWFTHSRGQKVYLSWPVPNCNEGCPASWIGDGYCDVACNVSACDWDANDCKNYTGPTYNWWNNNNNAPGGGSERDKKYCSPGCPDSWIGDKYCDRSCRVHECGFDAGDCEISELYRGMHGVSLDPQLTLVELPSPIPAVYFNLTGLVGENRIVDGSHDNAILVRTATISQKHKIMTLTLFPNIDRQTVVVSITAEINGVNTEFMFNITGHTKRGNATVETSSSNPNATASTEISSVGVSVEITDTVGNAQTSESSVTPAVTGEPPLDLHQNQGMKSRVGQAETERAETEKTEEERQRRSMGVVEDRRSRRSNVPDKTGSRRKPPGVRNLLSIEIDVDEDEEPEQDPDSVTPEDILLKLRKDAPIGEEAFQAVNSQVGAQFKGHQVDDQQLLEWIGRAMYKHTYVTTQKEVDRKEREQKKSSWHSLLDEEEPVWPWEGLLEAHNSLNGKPMMRGFGRGLKDLYADSLKFVNNLMNSAFGASARKVPAHMPHFLNKHLVEELQAKWPAEFDATSSHRLRDAHDMQFAFSYFYFLIHQRAEYNFTQVWNEYLDVDRSGELNTNELRNLAVHLYGTPVPANFRQTLMDKFRNCSYNATGVWEENFNASITAEVVENCEEIRKGIEKHFSKKPKNKHELLESDDVGFIMVGTNATNVEKSLDGMREKRQKFICLNDNMNHSNPEAVNVLRVLKDFYESLFPLPSSFELPPGEVNRFLYMDEYRKFLEEERLKQEAEQKVQDSNTTITIGLVSVALCLVCYTCKRCVSSCYKRRNSREQRFRKLLNP